ncbi:ionotropic receptor 75a-like [Topomyia yanbarensis]|uniref:ionotropic receptor 75a-like n=1 Tax=Topomyia yanbarensis TaxID=2498891 RepID=UPI00273A7C89|nr:ionotropic receptor 75a-like [Topomyia yanbarensis]
MSPIQLLLLAVMFYATDTVDMDAVIDFLKMKYSKSVVFFICDSNQLPKIYTKINEENISVRVVQINKESVIFPPNILPYSSYSRTTCVFDYSCDESLPILQNFSDLHYFNITYNWLFLAENDTTVDANNVLWKLKSIQMNTDLTILENVSNSSEKSYDLIDVYAKGRHLCKDIYQHKYGIWNSDKGITMVPGYNRYYLRYNFDGLQLRGVTVIDRDNVTSKDVDSILETPGSTQGVVVFVKYHYALLCILRDYHNFRIKFRIARGWAGRLKSGYRLGLLGILARNEVDVAATGIFQRTNRHAEFDIIHLSWEFSAGFIYRMTPQLSDASGGGNFFTPFDENVWIASAVTMIVLLIVLKLSSLIFSRIFREDPHISLVTYFLEAVASIAQQGLSGTVSPRMPIRIILFSLLVLNLVLYNYYTSSVVGGLLSSPGKGPQTIKEIIESPLTLSFRDIGYHKILFRETKKPIIQELYQKKLRPSREGLNTIPVYTDVSTAVPYLKKGGYAFHCEMTEAFEAIADQFDAVEICELRTAAGLFADLKLMSFVLPKRSMYTELFKITMMRTQEIGLVKRNLKIYKIEKPICQSGSRVNPVELPGVSLAFAVLVGGIVLALILLLMERFSWKQKSLNGLHEFLH